jgi:hypothetical protein
LKERVKAVREAVSPDASGPVDPQRIRASISRLEALLVRLEKH